MRGFSARIFVFLIILSLCLFSAFADNSIYEAEELLINQTISSVIDLSLLPGSSLNWITANFSFLPFSEDRQQVINQKFTPDISQRGEDWVVFQWKNPEEGKLKYTVSHVVRTKNSYEPVTGKVPFPVSKNDYDVSLQKYTKATELIDISPEIERKAKELAGDSTDLFEVAFNIADWVTTNIKYDLNTITADASQKATWVFDTRTGVCDELSTLYMAMLRSLDVPVRFVSGVSHTNSPLFDQPWNAHAWAEVYFPDHGWVPFDLTYQQFGYIDASHIKLKVSDDGDDSTTTYLWEGHNLDGVDVSLNNITFETQIMTSKGARESDIEIEARLLKDEIGFGSYDAVELKLTNLRSHYVTNTFAFSSASEVTFTNTNGHIPVFLKPLQTVYVTVPFVVSKYLDPSSKYTIPIGYSDLHANSGTLKVNTHSRAQVYGLTDINVIALQEQEIAKSENVLESYSFGCGAQEKDVFVGEKVIIECLAEQTAEKLVRQDILICFLGECKPTTLENEASVTFDEIFDEVGETQGLIKLVVGKEEKVGKFSVIVNDKAQLAIDSLSAPTSIKYGESLNVSFLIQKNSFADAQDVKVRVGRVVPSVWDFGKITLDQNMTVGFTSKQMVPGLNTFKVNITYFDGDQIREVSEKIDVELTDVPFFTSIWLYFVDLFA